MPPVLTGITPATELDATNVLLSVIGEAPLPAGTDLSAVTNADVEAAIQLLRESLRNVLAEGWRFNTEYGYEVRPTAVFPWPDTSGVTTQLNIFKPPPKSLASPPTPTGGQTGWREVDAVVRPSRLYTEAGVPVLVLYDRAKNRDGFAAADYPSLYVDPIWLFDFEQLPDEARTYITVLASRRMASRVLASASITGFTQQDEMLALRALRRAHGLKDSYNIFHNAGSYRWFGGRRPLASGMVDPRGTPGPA